MRMGILVLVFLVSGCSTVEMDPNDAQLIPQSRIISELSTTSDTPATLIFVRGRGLTSIEHVFQIFINGQHLANLRTGEKYVTNIDPGSAILELKQFNVMGRIAPAQVETILEENETYVYQATIDGNLNLTLRRDFNNTYAE